MKENTSDLMHKHTLERIDNNKVSTQEWRALRERHTRERLAGFIDWERQRADIEALSKFQKIRFDRLLNRQQTEIRNLYGPPK